MRMFNSQCTVAFTVLHRDDVPTRAEFRRALMERIEEIEHLDIWDEACWPPEDTDIEEEELR